MARARGAALTAGPVFPVRLFTPSRLWVRRDSPLTHPAALAGRRVAPRSWQHGFSLVARADLSRHYGVPWQSIRWVTAGLEQFPLPSLPAAWKPAVDAARPAAERLAAGGFDALIAPYLPLATVAGYDLRRLPPDPRGEERRYWQRWGYCPIIDLVVVRQDLAAARPDIVAALPAAVARAQAAAPRQAAGPNWHSLL